MVYKATKIYLVGEELLKKQIKVNIVSLQASPVNVFCFSTDTFHLYTLYQTSLAYPSQKR